MSQLRHALFCLEIDKVQKDDPKKDEEETYLDLFSHKNMKLKERVLIPVKQYPKVKPARDFKMDIYVQFYNCLLFIFT